MPRPRVEHCQLGRCRVTRDLGARLLLKRAITGLPEGLSGNVEESGLTAVDRKRLYPSLLKVEVERRVVFLSEPVKMPFSRREVWPEAWPLFLGS